MRMRFVLAAAGSGLLLALTACSGATSDPAAGGAESPAVSTAPSAQTGDASPAASVDVCALVSATELAAAFGTDPGEGMSYEENGLAQCTWSQDGTDAALLDYSTQPDVDFPDSLWPKKGSAVDVPGVDHGWSDAAGGALLVVKNGKGLLLNDFFTQVTSGDQTVWSQLAVDLAAGL